MSTKLRFMWLLIILCGLFLVGCGGNSLRPVEEEQIKNVVKDFYVRNTEIPEQEVLIEEVADDWARVAIKPAATESDTNLAQFYLQKQVGEGDAPPVRPAAQPSDQVPVTTSSGWTIILGPQVEFSEADLDAVGVPESVRE